jgi:membrane associated rhomboid family serine protease
MGNVGSHEGVWRRRFVARLMSLGPMLTLTAHRLSTYPFIHLGIFHTIVNIVALTPLLDKFEQENGTLVTVILFSGRTFPFFHRWTRN